MDSKLNKNRQFLSLILSICIIYMSLALSVSASEFTDISNHWAQDNIQRWLNKDLIKGYSDGSFRPNNNINRAEFITIVNKALGYKSTTPISYSDVQLESWYYKSIETAVAAGYLNGYPNGTIKPENSITREEVATILMNINKLSENKNAANAFTDSSNFTWSKGAIGAVYKESIMKDFPDGSFRNQTFIKRGEALVALDQNLTEGKNTDQSFTDGPKITVAYNHAYQENYESDSLEKIESNAKNAYILLDGDDSQAIKLIPKFKKNNNVISAYISVGTGEEWREDFKDLKAFLVTKNWDQWSGEYFINDVNTGVVSVMKKRLDKLASLGFQWVEFDNMDWAFDTEMRKEYGFKVTSQDAVSYYQELARHANSIGLKVMAKNTTTGADLFEGVTYESYNNNFNWWPERELKDFLDQGKLALIIHYNESKPELAYQKYQAIYGKDLLFIAESTVTKGYINFSKVAK